MTDKPVVVYGASGYTGRLGEVSDMADAVVFLASDSARFVNGVGLPVDGGMGM
jgi:NAD(P)-dependent dehydrogenase (short-subunit alcohol dehydrogenase family)